MKENTSFAFLLLMLFASINVSGQTDKKIQNNSSFFDRVYVGGDLGLQFGDITNVKVAPIFGYRVNNDLSVGLGIQYQYTRFKNFAPALTSNNYGTSLFTRYQIKAPFFLQAEYEYLNYQYFVRASEKVRKAVSSFFVGGGVLQPIGRNAVFTISVMYNLSYEQGDLTSPYNSPFKINAGINFGL